MNHWSVIGVMSGTSLDGLDIAFCQFESGSNGEWSYQIKAAECFPYDKFWKQKLSMAHLLNGLDLLMLNNAYGLYIGEIINSFRDKYSVYPDFIASHGHTIFHQPDNKISFQLGAGAAISAKTGMMVVCDFRAIDVHLGGQGAPLVPMGDALLFKEYDYCLNLGGIANISFEQDGNRLAYDICGCNLLLNAMANEMGLEYDEDGMIAESGTINLDLLQALNQWHYYSKPAPKSLDKETMLSELLPIINVAQISIEDKMATLASHIAGQILNAVKKDTGSILITGGGAFNKSLINSIQNQTSLQLYIPDDELINFKEAIIFSFLGLLRVLNRNNTLASVTGALHDSIGGAIYPGNSKT